MLKVCVMSDSFHHCSKMSGRGTNRTLVYPVPQAEIISILTDSRVRTGVPACVD
jgi:hypothetical protein